MTKIIASVLVLVGVGVMIYLIIDRNPVSPAGLGQVPAEFCYYKETKTASGLHDTAWLTMSLEEDRITGEYNNIPAEKDKKVGTFEGVVSSVDPTLGTISADLWWGSMAEGMNVTEELHVVFGETEARVGIGEMIDRGDGVYIYKDKSTIGYWQVLDILPCGDLDDKMTVGAYVRENIKTLAPEDPVLGGTWYVVSVTVHPQTKTGVVMYEDGHIQGNATFSYQRDGENIVISDMQKQGPLVSGDVFSGEICFSYNQKATGDLPYTVAEEITLSIENGMVSGTKTGSQFGPDMTNGYTGTLSGVFENPSLSVVYSYEIEGSAQKEKELYTLSARSLVKHRYSLVEQGDMLVPDRESEPRDVVFTKVSCS